MDPHGNIYEAQEMRRRLALQDEQEPVAMERAKRLIAEDEARLDGYLKGLSEMQAHEAEKQLRERLAAPKKEPC